MFNRRALLVMAVCAVLTSSTAFAGGGGGTKKDSTISVRNDTGAVSAAAVDPTPAFLALGPGATATQIEAAGGKVINPGATADFKVSAGTYRLVASNGLVAGDTNVTVGKGKTRKFALTNAGTFVEFN